MPWNKLLSFKTKVPSVNSLSTTSFIINILWFLKLCIPLWGVIIMHKGSTQFFQIELATLYLKHMYVGEAIENASRRLVDIDMFGVSPSFNLNGSWLVKQVTTFTIFVHKKFGNWTFTTMFLTLSKIVQIFSSSYH